MIIYVENTIERISQFTKWWDSKSHLKLETVLNLEVSARDSLKQVKIEAQQGSWNDQVSSRLLLLEENAICHWCTKNEQLRFVMVMEMLSQNSWRSMFIEHTAKRITRIDEELKEFGWILFLKVLDEFGELEGKVVRVSCDLWFWSKVSYD